MGTFNVESDKIAAIILATAKAVMNVATRSDNTGTRPCPGHLDWTLRQSGSRAFSVRRSR